MKLAFVDRDGTISKDYQDDQGVEHMNNNFKALVLHFVIIIVSFAFLVIYVATGPKIGQYTTNIISRLFIGIVFLLVYILSGTLLDIHANKRYDFFTGCLIAIIGIILWFYTISISGGNLFIIPEEVSEYWILMNTYHIPFIFINFLFKLPNTPLLSLIINLLPTLLMGLGLKYKRLKHIKI